MKQKSRVNYESLDNKDKTSFVDYYNKHKIIPVSQDTSDPDFIFKRNFLYSKLGCPLSFFRGRTVLEFGPGGGFNAIATSSSNPELYVFVDAAIASLEELQRKKINNYFGANRVEIVDANIFDYKDERQFDFVIIEGVIPGQIKPIHMLKHAGSFVSPGGVLVTTTMSATSLISEICRSLFRVKIINSYTNFEDQVNEAASIFEPHLLELGTKTRPAKDWVLDTVLHEFKASLTFSITDSINVLDKEFEFYGSSPSYLIDDRFYKKVNSSGNVMNDLARSQYKNLTLSLIDYRIPLTEALKEESINEEVESICKSLHEIHDLIIKSNSYSNIDNFLKEMKNLREILPPSFNPTIAAIANFEEAFPYYIDDSNKANFKEFSKWWGRGQQYLSFIKNYD
jgi:2-polyprenyl-3-methyl-5-hydroxy-6-metoxy-1,4-benzoquinol methylase